MAPDAIDDMNFSKSYGTLVPFVYNAPSLCRSLLIASIHSMHFFINNKNIFTFSKFIIPSFLWPLAISCIEDKIVQEAVRRIQGTVTASLMLRKLGSYPRKNGLALALRELGQIER